MLLFFFFPSYLVRKRVDWIVNVFQLGKKKVLLHFTKINEDFITVQIHNLKFEIHILQLQSKLGKHLVLRKAFYTSLRYSLQRYAGQEIK